MRSSTKEKKIVNIREDREQIVWVKVMQKVVFSTADTISVAFSKPNNAGKRMCTLRIGNDIMQQLKWNTGDKIDVYFSENNPYMWKVVKSSAGFTFREEQNNKCSKLFAFTWRQDGVTFTRARKVENFQIKKDHIILDISMTEETDS